MLKKITLLLLCLITLSFCSNDESNTPIDGGDTGNTGTTGTTGTTGNTGNTGTTGTTGTTGNTGSTGTTGTTGNTGNTGTTGTTGDTNTDPDRYNKEVFTDFEVATVIYGNNTTQGGVTKDLDMDIYTPKGDTETKRPLVILAHGGSFINGSKDQFKNLGLAQMLSKSGYVVGLISYRLIDINVNANTSTVGTIQAISDMRAAVRYFRKDNAENNTYKIDVDNVFVGGYSAGAITALHVGYINSKEEIQTVNPFLSPLFDANGGFEGDSGNPGFSSEVKGVINISGAIISTDFIQKEDPIVYSIHGTNDATVAFEGTGTGLKGSGPIHRKADAESITNKLNAVQGAGHDIIFRCPTCNTEIRDFLFNNLN
ncbi:alpha/beta hydrolase [Aquimarina sp. AD10]|uniref:alpha/beta hydrolase n=1 Tax=Aquimarina sp. AD10 TaxID=1714849 RepID=UPI000E4A6E9B|nr:alpha/beta hydrolase [Aquimarina sp. AD10]AXT61126.1 alpha/beta hydrolase [Aquimarina sp. AD10]RKN02258.1 alpha/beta hydrolase [Aquimarina sp. AD10]